VLLAREHKLYGMKRLAISIAMLLALTVTTAAETVYMKSGSKLTGKVLEETETRVKLEVDVEGGGKAVITIDKSRIDRIETADSFKARIEAAEQLLKDEDFRRAESDYRELVRNEPRDARVRLGLAKALVGLYKYEEAVKTLEHYLLLVDRDRDTDLMLYLADQYLQARNFRDAKRTAREAADLYPNDKGLQTTVDDFLKRCDRVRSGTEQLKERETAESAERKRRQEERKEWDKEKGNSWESVEFGQALSNWTAESRPKLILGRYLNIEAPRDEWNRYLLGADEERLHGAVTRADLKFIVDETRWLELYDHQKAVILYGWYYQMKDRYPKTFPVVEVVCIVQERGKDKETKLARGSWDGRRDQVVIDRWTKENREPGRPTRRVIK
jgi:tetratricopeptide (TPR) repeat protein